jgi:hypothetical protein
MNKDSLICKIYFYDAGYKATRKIIGVVNKKQLFSSLNSFIEVRNYGNKIISKHDVERVIVYEKQAELVIAKNSLEVNTPLKIEG